MRHVDREGGHVDRKPQAEIPFGIEAHGGAGYTRRHVSTLPGPPIRPARAPRVSPAEGHPALARRAAPALLLVALLTAAIYLPSLSNGFVSWDDPENFLKNPWYRGLGPAQLRWMFTHFWMGHYQPLTWVTLGFDYLVWGLNPRGYHLTSLLVHADGTGVFALVAARLFLLAQNRRGQVPAQDW